MIGVRSREVSCQTWEGGFGGEPYSEAHGGYTFCAVAAIQIWLFHTKQWDYIKTIINIDTLLQWLTVRQLSYEGGFNGRSNKLVDGCYSFWQGSALVIVSNWVHDILYFDGNGRYVVHYDPWIVSFDAHNHSISSSNNNKMNTKINVDPPIDHGMVPLLFDHAMLERYILLCAQDVNGGLRDKPSKSRDFYHSCYNLSGLSIANHYSVVSVSPSSSSRSSPIEEHNDDDKEQHVASTQHQEVDTHDKHNNDRYHFGHIRLSQVAPTHPCYNIRIEKVKFIQHLFS
jgi:protein farnesyltransferase subunit beta